MSGCKVPHSETEHQKQYHNPDNILGPVSHDSAPLLIKQDVKPKEGSDFPDEATA